MISAPIAEHAGTGLDFPQREVTWTAAEINHGTAHWRRRAEFHR